VVSLRHTIFVRRPEGTRPLCIPNGRREDNIKTDIAGTDYEHMSWIHLVQDKFQLRSLVSTVTKANSPIFLATKKLLNSQDGFINIAAIPVQTWIQAQGFRSLRLPDFLIIGMCMW